MTEEPPRSSHLPPGYDEDDPYQGEDLSEYPSWWRRNVAEFRSYGLRPYRPPRFSDGELTPEVIEHLEADLDVSITIRNTDPQGNDAWQVVVDGEPAISVDRQRTDEGYTLYELPSDGFVAAVREAVGNRDLPVGSDGDLLDPGTPSDI